MRDRYRAEFLADLDSLPTRAQIRYATGVLLSVNALRRATRSTGVAPMEETMTMRKPLLCRTNLHHRWERFQSDDGVGYTQCARCGKEKWTGLGGDRSVAANVIANYGSMN